MGRKKTMKLAARGKRFAAACIDSAVPFAAYVMLRLALRPARAGFPGYGYGFGNGFGGGFGYDYGFGDEFGYGLGGPGLSVVSGGLAAVAMLLLAAYIIVEFIFYSKSESIGKAMLGMQVISSINGRPVGFWKMLLRECIVKQASAVLLLGYIWILIDDKNRGWHDKILDTYVVDLRESALIAAGGAYQSGGEAPPEAPEQQEYPDVPAPAAAAEAETGYHAAPEHQDRAEELPKAPVIRLDD